MNQRGKPALYIALGIKDRRKRFCFFLIHMSLVVMIVSERDGGDLILDEDGISVIFDSCTVDACYPNYCGYSYIM